MRMPQKNQHKQHKIKVQKNCNRSVLMDRGKREAKAQSGVRMRVRFAVHREGLQRCSAGWGYCLGSCSRTLHTHTNTLHSPPATVSDTQKQTETEQGVSRVKQLTGRPCVCLRVCACEKCPSPRCAGPHQHSLSDRLVPRLVPQQPHIREEDASS